MRLHFGNVLLDWALFSVVNFTNKLRAAFAPISLRQKIINLSLKYKKLFKQLSYGKAAHKILMKLTPAVVFYLSWQVEDEDWEIEDSDAGDDEIDQKEERLSANFQVEVNIWKEKGFISVHFHFHFIFMSFYVNLVSFYVTQHYDA